MDFDSLEDFSPNHDYVEIPEADERNGHHLVVEVGLGDLIAGFIGKIGGQILSGNLDVLSVIPPAQVLGEYDYLELLSCTVASWVEYMKAASEKNHPTERLKIITAGFIANWHLTDMMSQGNMPIPVFPGEYLEGVKKDGTYFFAHNVVKDPVTNNIRVVGPNEAYIFEFKYFIDVKPNSLFFTEFRCTRVNFFSAGLKKSALQLFDSDYERRDPV